MTIDESSARLYAFLVVALSAMFITTHHPFMVYSQRIGMRARVAVSTLVFKKVLKLSKSAMNKTAIGQVINHLSNDVNRFDEVCHSKY